MSVRVQVHNMSIGGCVTGGCVELVLEMDSDQRINAALRLLGGFTAETVTQILVAEFGELVEAKE